MAGEKQGGQNPSPRAYSGKTKAQMCEDVAEVALDAGLVEGLDVAIAETKRAPLEARPFRVG